MKRKYYIDNLRWLAILLLFPFHASQVWSGGENSGFYVWSHTDSVLFAFSNAVYPWYMTLLFAIAGMSCRYALEKRTPREFVSERFKKLFIPMLFGVFALAPVMTYYAEVYFNGYTGSFFGQYIMFFTKSSDLTGSGYRGGFTVGHYWFLLYLFVISLLSLAVILPLKKRKTELGAGRMPYAAVVALFLAQWLFMYVLNFGGKSVGQFMILYLFGYFILSDELVLQKLLRYRFVSLALCVVSGAAYTYLYCFKDVRDVSISALYNFYGWTGIITLLGIGQSKLDFHNALTAYLSRASFPVYILHMPVVVAVSYYVLKLHIAVMAQFAIITVISAVITFIIYEIVRRIPVLSFLLGISRRKIGG